MLLAVLALGPLAVLSLLVAQRVIPLQSDGWELFGWFLFAFLTSLTLLILFRLLRNRPAIEIDERGLLNRTGFVNRWVGWDEITALILVVTLRQLRIYRRDARSVVISTGWLPPESLAVITEAVRTRSNLPNP